jgi:isopentenyldiphosphate isomerase
VPEERVAVIDESGQVVGSAPRSVVRRDNLPHLVVAALVRDPRGRIYVHRRTDTKDVFPGLHDCWVAGCVTADELPDAAIVRELDEELGVRGVPVRRLFEARYSDAYTRQLSVAYSTTYEGPITHQPDEVACGGWVTLDELRPLMAREGWATPDGRALFEEWLRRPAAR